MTIKQILALSAAGFDEEQISKLQAALDGQQEQPEQQEQQAQPEQQEQQEKPEKPADPEAPAWFGKFLERYNADIEQLSQGVKARNVRRAGSDPGAQPKTPEQLMAEAYNNIK